MTQYLNPDWENTSRVHDWRNYISEEMQQIWDTFSEEQKRVIYENTESMANREEWD